MQDKLHEILDNLLTNYRIWVDVGGDHPIAAARQAIEQLLLEARLEEAEKMWDKFDGVYSDAIDLSEYAPKRIREIKAKLRFMEK